MLRYQAVQLGLLGPVLAIFVRLPGGLDDGHAARLRSLYRTRSSSLGRISKRAVPASARRRVTPRHTGPVGWMSSEVPSSTRSLTSQPHSSRPTLSGSFSGPAYAGTRRRLPKQPLRPAQLTRKPYSFGPRFRRAPQMVSITISPAASSTV
jgi:hypothetical protein